MPAGTLFDHISITDQNSPSISQAYLLPTHLASRTPAPYPITPSSNMSSSSEQRRHDDALLQQSQPRQAPAAQVPRLRLTSSPRPLTRSFNLPPVCIPAKPTPVRTVSSTLPVLFTAAAAPVSQQVTTKWHELNGGTPIIPAVTGCTVGAAAGAAGTCTMGGSSTATRMFFPDTDRPFAGWERYPGDGELPAGRFPTSAVCTYSVASTVSPAGGHRRPCCHRHSHFGLRLYEIDTLPASTSIGIGVLCQ